MALTPERWRAIQTVFHAVVDLPGEQRNETLEELCGADPDLLHAVRELLQGDAGAESLLDRDLDAVAGRVLDSTVPPADYGPYRVVRWLGEGGMGVIYLATRDDLGQTAAIKVLRHVWVSPSGRERFAAEQRTLARLNHPSIAAIYDADTLADGTPWFAMEYVEGQTLTEYCNARGLGFVERVRLFRDVCEAVQHAHQLLVVHRDLKPSNILVAGDRRVKLLDFGIAKQLDLLDDASTARTATARLLTLNYASPEQLTGGPVGIHTDVYALGVILYELLAGRRPLDLTNLSPVEAQRVLQQEEPPRPSLSARAHASHVHAGAAMWADVDVLCLKALHKDPVRRYRTVDAMMADLDRLLSSRPLEARPDSAGYRAGKFVRRHRQAVLATAVVALLIAGVVGFYTMRLRSARNAAVAEAARTSRVVLFLERLFEGGESDEAPASELRVLTLVDRGAREARSLEAQPDIQAELYVTLGTIYQNLGEFDKANELLQASLDGRRAAGNEDDPGAADSLIALGLLRADQAKLAEAETLTRSGLEIATRVLPANHPTIAKAELALGKVLRERGEYGEAVQWLNRAATAYGRSPATESELSVALNLLATTHYYAGEFDLSEALNERVLALDRKAYGNAHPSVADSLINLAAIQSSRGRPADALPKYREAARIFEQWYGPTHPETASAQTGLAQMLLRLNQYDEAIGLFERALAAYRAAYKESHPRLAIALTGVGLVALARNQLDVAEQAFEESLKVYRDVYGDKHSRIAATLVNLAALSTARGNAAAAERWLREGVGMYEATLPADHTTTAAARIKLAHLLLQRRRYEEAETQLLTARQALEKQREPPIDSLRSLLEDLVQLFDATNRPERAAEARSRLNRLTPAPSPAPAT